MITKTAFFAIYFFLAHKAQILNNQVHIHEFFIGNTSTKQPAYIVLPLSQMRTDDFKDYKSTTLASNDFDLIDSKLKEFADEYNGNEKKRLQEHLNNFPALKNRRIRADYIGLDYYKRQYICGIDKNGDKIVWVNCFCGEQPYWKSQAVVVFDGGSCFFNLKINLTKKVKYDVVVNGVA